LPRVLLVRPIPCCRGSTDGKGSRLRNLSGPRGYRCFDTGRWPVLQLARSVGGGRARADHDRDRERFWPRVRMGKTADASDRLHFPNRASVHALNWFQICGYTRVSHFVSMLLLVLALTLTLCFGVAAWRVSAGNDVEITATIPHGEYGWRARSRN
jgi:hypothetical protein